MTYPEAKQCWVGHADLDAFYASVEKRDNPDLADKPVIIGGGRRGVVSTACYVARIKGVKSAMPMFQALKLCPEAVVVRPRFDAYTEASRAIRAMMDELTPVVGIQLGAKVIDQDQTPGVGRAWWRGRHRCSGYCVSGSGRTGRWRPPLPDP